MAFKDQPSPPVPPPREPFYEPYGEPPRRRAAGRIGAKALSRFCHNVGTSLQAGVDIRRVWETESHRGPPQQRSEMMAIRDRLDTGDTLTSAMLAAGGYFPSLVVEMVEVGERSGRLEQVFTRLGEHYDHVLKLRRAFLIGIAWPMIELTMAVLVIGLMIFILGIVHSGPEAPPITFFGLYGTRGLLIYTAIIGFIVGGFALLMFAVKKGLLNIDPLLRVLMIVPGLGQGLQTLYISRLTWSLAMASDSDIDPRKVLELAVRTTQNSYYTAHIPRMKQVITDGGQMIDAFQQPGVFPDDFLDALQTGEISGTISETMAVMARQYEERANQFYRLLTIIAGVLVFLAVAAVIIFMIFALAAQYFGMLNEFLP